MLAFKCFFFKKKCSRGNIEELEFRKILKDICGPEDGEEEISGPVSEPLGYIQFEVFQEKNRL